MFWLNHLLTDIAFMGERKSGTDSQVVRLSKVHFSMTLMIHLLYRQPFGSSHSDVLERAPIGSYIVELRWVVVPIEMPSLTCQCLVWLSVKPIDCNFNVQLRQKVVCVGGRKWYTLTCRPHIFIRHAFLSPFGHNTQRDRRQTDKRAIGIDGYGDFKTQLILTTRALKSFHVARHRIVHNNEHMCSRELAGQTPSGPTARPA